jgi:hypothetical protein
MSIEASSSTRVGGSDDGFDGRPTRSPPIPKVYACKANFFDDDDDGDDDDDEAINGDESTCLSTRTPYVAAWTRVLDLSRVRERKR